MKTARNWLFNRWLYKEYELSYMVDFGAPNFALFSPVQQHFEDGERIRFVEHSLERLTHQHGVQEISAVIPSHYHDDHINGIPYLQQQLNVECWAYENMREILENPRIAIAANVTFNGRHLGQITEATVEQAR